MTLTIAASALSFAQTAGQNKSGEFSNVIHNASSIHSDLAKYQTGKNMSAELKDVIEEPSFNISTPKINMAKINSPTKIASLKNKNAFYEELDEHNVKYDPETITYSEYCMIENTWSIDETTMKEISELYPELSKNKDLSYGAVLNYQIKKDRQDFGKKFFSDEQLAELERRNITLDDAASLLKEYQNADVLLRQSDSVLKQVLTDIYKMNLKVLESYSQAEKESSPVKAPVSNFPYPNLYTYVYFPQYMNGQGDYFHNDVLTTKKWQVRQANRARRTQSVMYDTPYSTTQLKCTNLYGTYSKSQKGAHEGIDFAAKGGAVNIRSVTWGGRRYPTLYHQFAVHDANHADGAKTYSYLHMSYLNSNIAFNETVGINQYIGNQGQEGNSDGYHVHFEVHSGNIGDLSSGKDQALESLSPYRLTQYIGEGDPLPEEEQYW